LYKETEIPEAESRKMKYATEPYKSPTVSLMKKFLVVLEFYFSMLVVFLQLIKNGFLN
jgi:hypothetical protein